PSEAHLLDEFVPEERLVNRIEAVIRVFGKFGNRANKNKARLKFVLRERGFEWVKEQIEKEYDDILRNGGIEAPEAVPENFGGFQSTPPPLGSGELLPVLSTNGHPNPAYERWLDTNVRRQKQDGYFVATVKVEQGNLTTAQLRGLATISRQGGDGAVRFSM